MRFNLVDRIVEFGPGKHLRAIKNLTLGEEYLADHFPTFPVMPGVLMLQTLVEAGAWYCRLADDFRHSVIVLREAKGVKYGNFMEPGKSLTAVVEPVEMTETSASFKGGGEMEGNSAVTARLTLARYNLRDRNPALAGVDQKIIDHYRGLYLVLSGQMEEPACVSRSEKNDQRLSTAGQRET